MLFYFYQLERKYTIFLKKKHSKFFNIEEMKKKAAPG